MKNAESGDFGTGYTILPFWPKPLFGSMTWTCQVSFGLIPWVMCRLCNRPSSTSTSIRSPHRTTAIAAMTPSTMRGSRSLPPARFADAWRGTWGNLEDERLETTCTYQKMFIGGFQVSFWPFQPWFLNVSHSNIEKELKLFASSWVFASFLLLCTLGKTSYRTFYPNITSQTSIPSSSGRKVRLSATSFLESRRSFIPYILQQRQVAWSR